MKDFEFVVKTEPDQETIKEFHKILAQALINKHGEKTMKEVVKIANNKK